MQKLIERLEKLAARKIWEDDPEFGQDSFPNDYAGGNIDDAYSGGVETGQTQLAREILVDLRALSK